MNVGERPEFLLEAVESRGREVKQRLQGDGLPALAIERLVDDPHPALSEAAHDLVALGAFPFGSALPLTRGGHSGHGALRRRHGLRRVYPHYPNLRACLWRSHAKRGALPRASRSFVANRAPGATMCARRFPRWLAGLCPLARIPV
jgi:hypothetical protein